MSRNAHCLDHLLGHKLVSSHSPPERRKTPAELARMSHEDRLHYQLHAPELTDAEKTEELEAEDLRHRLGMNDDELSWADLDRMGPPPEWGE